MRKGTGIYRMRRRSW